jgi:N-carbamoylputrescine amidase
MQTFTVGLIQANFRSGFEEKNAAIARVADFSPRMGPAEFAHNHALFASMVRDAASRGAQLVLGPESYLDGWSFKPEVLDAIAAPIPGPQTDALAQLARDAGVWICIGVFERAGRDIYNSAVLVSADGDLAGVYRKTHETRGVLEKMPYQLGDRLGVFDTPWGRAGILICHDRWYPENARALKRRGAEFVLNPTATAVFSPGHAYHDVHDAVLRSHAYLNELFWISCNSANHGGHSLVVGPDGRVLARASAEQEALLVKTVPPDSPGFGFASNLRDHLYAVPS